jgi:hypothetical protein
VGCGNGRCFFAQESAFQIIDFCLQRERLSMTTGKTRMVAMSPDGASVGWVGAAENPPKRAGAGNALPRTGDDGIVSWRGPEALR